MKKNILKVLVLLIMLLTIVSCKKETTLEEVKILVPGGTPALSQMYIENEKDKYNYKIDLADGSDALSAAFLSKSYDFIYAPLNIGAKMYINNKNYKLLATVVDLNYYFVGMSDSNLTIESIKDKKIVIFGENAMSGIISRYILDDYESLDITYVNSVAESMSEFIKDNSVVALVSEPQLSIIESKVSGVKNISVKSEYVKKTGSSNIPQAAVFVRSDLDSKIVSKYNELLIDSIEKVNSNISESSELGSTLYPTFNKTVLTNALPRAEIKYTSSTDSKEKVSKFIEFLNNYNSKILNGNVDEEFYY